MKNNKQKERVIHKILPPSTSPRMEKNDEDIYLSYPRQNNFTDSNKISYDGYGFGYDYEYDYCKDVSSGVYKKRPDYSKLQQNSFDITVDNRPISLNENYISNNESNNRESLEQFKYDKQKYLKLNYPNNCIFNDIIMDEKSDSSRKKIIESNNISKSSQMANFLNKKTKRNKDTNIILGMNLSKNKSIEKYSPKSAHHQLLPEMSKNLDINSRLKKESVLEAFRFNENHDHIKNFDIFNYLNNKLIKEKASNCLPFNLNFNLNNKEKQFDSNNKFNININEKNKLRDLHNKCEKSQNDTKKTSKNSIYHHIYISAEQQQSNSVLNPFEPKFNLYDYNYFEQYGTIIHSIFKKIQQVILMGNNYYFSFLKSLDFFEKDDHYKNQIKILEMFDSLNYKTNNMFDVMQILNNQLNMLVLENKNIQNSKEFDSFLQLIKYKTNDNFCSVYTKYLENMLVHKNIKNKNIKSQDTIHDYQKNFGDTKTHYLNNIGTYNNSDFVFPKNTCSLMNKNFSIDENIGPLDKFTLPYFEKMENNKQSLNEKEKSIKKNYNNKINTPHSWKPKISLDLIENNNNVIITDNMDFNPINKFNKNYKNNCNNLINNNSNKGNNNILNPIKSFESKNKLNSTPLKFLEALKYYKRIIKFINRLRIKRVRKIKNVKSSASNPNYSSHEIKESELNTRFIEFNSTNQKVKNFNNFINKLKIKSKNVTSYLVKFFLHGKLLDNDNILLKYKKIKKNISKNNQTFDDVRKKLKKFLTLILLNYQNEKKLKEIEENMNFIPRSDCATYPYILRIFNKKSFNAISLTEKDHDTYLRYLKFLKRKIYGPVNNVNYLPLEILPNKSCNNFLYNNFKEPNRTGNNPTHLYLNNIETLNENKNFNNNLIKHNDFVINNINVHNIQINPILLKNPGKQDFEIEKSNFNYLNKKSNMPSENLNTIENNNHVISRNKTTNKNIFLILKEMKKEYQDKAIKKGTTENTICPSFKKESNIYRKILAKIIDFIRCCIFQTIIDCRERIYEKPCNKGINNTPNNPIYKFNLIVELVNIYYIFNGSTENVELIDYKVINKNNLNLSHKNSKINYNNEHVTNLNYEKNSIKEIAGMPIEDLAKDNNLKIQLLNFIKYINSENISKLLIGHYLKIKSLNLFQYRDYKNILKKSIGEMFSNQESNYTDKCDRIIIEKIKEIPEINFFLSINMNDLIDKIYKNSYFSKKVLEHTRESFYYSEIKYQKYLSLTEDQINFLVNSFSTRKNSKHKVMSSEVFSKYKEFFREMPIEKIFNKEFLSIKFREYIKKYCVHSRSKTKQFLDISLKITSNKIDHDIYRNDYRHYLYFQRQLNLSKKYKLRKHYFFNFKGNYSKLRHRKIHKKFFKEIFHQIISNKVLLKKCFVEYINQLVYNKKYIETFEKIHNNFSNILKSKQSYKKSQIQI